MQELIIYLLKSAGLMSLFYAAYFFLLKNETNFKTNRVFLLAGILTSVLLPFLEITRTIVVETAAAPVFFENLPAAMTSTPTVQVEKIDWWQIGGIVYLLGLSFFLMKFFIELFSLLKLIYSHKTYREGNVILIPKAGNVKPFSFFKYIIFDPDQHTPREREMILKHECSHASQWHSVDQLLTSLSVCLLWYNPLAWLYRKSVVQNLEYLADKEVIAAQVSKKEYQKTLLKISVGEIEPALTNQFYQSFIKKRIIMLNKNNTPKSNFWKTSLLLPFLLLFVFSFNVKTEAKAVPAQEKSQVSDVEVSVYVTKETQEKALRAYERLFEQQGVDLKFDDLEYNEGLLTRVAVSFRKESSGATGNLSLYNPKGIGSLFIHTNGKEVTMTPNVSAPRENEEPLSGIGNSPLYIIAGKEYSTSQLAEKYVVIKGEWNVLKPKEAEEKFGSKAKDGAIIISESNIVEDFKEALKDLDLSQGSFRQNFIQVKKDGPPVLLGVKTKVSKSFTPPTSASETHKPEFRSEIKNKADGENPILKKIGNNPLYIIDDKEYSASELSGKYVRVHGRMSSLTPTEGKIQYGDKAKDGVFIISEGEIGEDLQKEMKRIDREETELWAHYLEIWENKKPSLLTVDKKPSSGSNSGEGSTNYYKQTGSKAIPVNREGDKVPKRFIVTDFQYSFKESDDIIAIETGDEKNKKYNFQENKPLIVVGGEIKEKGYDWNSIDPNTIKGVTVLKGDNALEKYGERAKNGVIEIELLTAREAAKDKKNVHFSAGSINFEESESSAKETKNVLLKSKNSTKEKPYTISSIDFEESEDSGEKGTAMKISEIRRVTFPQADVLYILDGKKMKKSFDPSSMDPDDIESMNILKGPKARAKYGDKAGNWGVIEITTKK